MGHGEYDDASCYFAVDHGERKALQEYAPGIRRRRRTSAGEGKRAGRSLFDRSRETSAKARPLLVVVDDLGEELTACGRYEPS